MSVEFSKILTYVFVFIIYLFVYVIIRMIFMDIRMMYRKKTGGLADAYLKLINLRHEMDFYVDESYEVSENEVIGRGKKCDISIGDKYMSAKNSRIFKVSGKFYLEDLESTNGTYLNGKPLGNSAVELLDGDKISIGRVHFLFVLPPKNA
ncbi:MAG: FHA domain-containing protein [Ruminococcaceae bacterium]|nr:FHA domain-containing protein [Oscillospiraceae bacterium]